MYPRLSLVLATFTLFTFGQLRSFHGSTLDNRLVLRAVTPDFTCGMAGAGSGKGYTCDPKDSPCCSASGWCGSTAAYCDTGCQSDFGTCSGVTDPAQDPDLCGPKNNNAKCQAGKCCSVNGYCGATQPYCGDGCQAGFGQCGTVLPVAPGSTDCGPTGGNKQCPAGQCCSAGGYCGTEEYYCADPGNCQPDFGRCDSDTVPAGVSTINDPRPALGKVTYDLDIYNCVEPKVVALTYDDGPYKYTNELLDVLKQFGFKATFFMTGNNLGKGQIDRVEPWPTIVKRMITDGHQVASHTWSHYALSNLTHEKRVQQMVKNERAIANIIGKYPTYMRPPYSDCSVQSGCQADMKALGYHRTSFDLDTTDYLNPSPLQIQSAKDIVRQALTIATNPDYLAIQHDLVEQSVSNLTSYFLELIKAKGWRGVTVGECLQDPEENWYRVPGTGQGAPVSSLSTNSQTVSTTSKATPATSTPKPSTSSRVTSIALPSIVKSSSTSSRNTGTTTSRAPIATSSCLVRQANFCGTIPAFTGHSACLASLNSCNAQLRTCPSQAGNTAAGKSACARYGNGCNQLKTYCGFCGNNCKSTNPRYKSFVLGQ